ncbi:MAG: aminotransferase class V-fold PLP-dependent enzyme [Bryobacterales bacterium]|nr:aminotransferase class V-fold PLP-dependent enzyme [Acidobacteriota bacterium]MCB9384295.1 aminotransferase class V-fold PLP-dependent enzyme [Bryobacterales bacterium]
MTKRIYLDAHATTPVDPHVIEAMLPYFREEFGNPASRNHAFGWDAEKAVAKGREQAAELIGASPRELVFTSGATESNNLALKGAARGYQGKRNHIVSCVTEHRAVLDPLERLAKEGFRVTLLPVGPDGMLDLDRLRAALDETTLMVSLMAANNEVGVLHPVGEIGRMAREAGAVFHVDAAQALGKIPLDVEKDQIDLLSATAHKLYGPKGCGLLYVRRRGKRVDLQPQMDGGGHERGMRSGTLNVPGIVGLGAACARCGERMETESLFQATLRDRLFEGLEALGGVRLNGAKQPRLPNNLNVSFEGIDGETLLMALDDIAVSSGSACTSAEPKPSHVLRAMGVPDKLAHASLRFGLHRWTTADDVDYAVDKVSGIVKRLRAGA